MTTQLSIAADGDGTWAVAGDAVRFAPATRRQVGADAGDTVRIEGGATTVATVGEDCPDLSDGTVLVGETVGRNVEAGDGSTVAVDPVSPVPARTVTVRPLASSLDGSPDALARALVGRPLTIDDRVDARLFGGSVVVSLVVVDLDPSGPAVVTPETTLDVRERSDGAPPSTPSGRVAGLDDERARLRRLVVDPLSNAYARVGARTPAGVLVHGPPGTGKSLLVRRVAADAAITVHDVPPDDCARRSSLSTTLREAANDTPAILFLEDLAVAAPDPDSGREARPTSQVGWLLDRVRDRDEVVVVGETAHPDEVDPALRRGGRFDAEVRLGVPDRPARREILACHAADVRLAADVDLDAVAARTHGYTGADLEALLVDAATRAVAQGDDDPVVASRDVSAALDAVGPSTLRNVTVERPSVTYRDVGGLTEAKREVIRTVEWPLRYPALFERLSATAPTGVLLYGPPGTGKTMLAKAVANSTDANFLAVDGPELMDRYVGESERGVREVFERARRTAPSVVFLDELDAFAPTRRETDTGAAERVVSQLLTELDGLSARGDVAVLGATNRADAVDPALLRPGRIERRVAVPLPDEAARAEILAVHLDDVPTRDVDTAAVAAETAGYSGSDLAGVVREAALLAMEAHLRTESSTGALDGLVVESAHLERAVQNTRPSTDDAA